MLGALLKRWRIWQGRPLGQIKSSDLLRIGYPYMSEDDALTLETLAACLRVKSESMASAACILQRIRTKDGGIEARPAIGHPLYTVIGESPNPRQSRFEWIAQMVVDLDLHGNHYSLIQRNAMGQVTALHPVPAPDVEPYWVNEPYTHAYRYNPPNGGEQQQFEAAQTLMPGEVLHVKSMPVTSHSYHGLKGVGILQLQSPSLNLNKEARAYVTDMFRNNAGASGILSIHGRMNSEQKDELIKDFDDKASRGKTKIVGSQADYRTIEHKPVDAQVQQQRMDAKEEICRITGVPPFAVYLPGHTTYSNTEQQVRAFYGITISKLAARIQSAMRRDLLGPRERSMYRIRFDQRDMTSGDPFSQARTHKLLFDMGAISPNEIREERGMNPRAGGDEYAPMPQPKNSPQPKPGTDGLDDAVATPVGGDPSTRGTVVQ